MSIGQKRSRHINALCLLLGHSRQAFYQQKRAKETEVLQHELVIQQVLEIRERQKKVGARKLLTMLQPFLSQHNISLGRDAFFRLLAENGLLVRRRSRKAPRTTYSDHWMRKYPNLIQDRLIDAPNQLWVSDITYIDTAGGFGYLSLVTDAYSRKITGFHLSKTLAAEGCVKALKMALKSLPPHSSLTHHSDRGCQYCSAEYVAELTKKDIAVSMTQNSDPRENAIAERVNGILKLELLETTNSTYQQAQKQVNEAVYIYNHERIHSSLNMLTPAQAQLMNGTLKKHWKNYYTPKKEVTMT